MKPPLVMDDRTIELGQQRANTVDPVELKRLANKAVERLSKNRVSNRWTTAQRWWSILRYHHKSQLVRRLWKVVRGNRKPTASTNDLLEIRSSSDWQLLLDHKIAERQSDTLSAKVDRTFVAELTFLNESCQLSDPVDWRLANNPEISHLWRFHLHYQEYLLDLIANETHPLEHRMTTAWKLVEQWISGNLPNDPATRNDAWHPFCISRRLPIWCLLWQATPPSADLQPGVLKSIATQAHSLEANLELDLGGNHLLENARALAFAGAFFGGPAGDRWLEAAHQLFRQELLRQILPSGEHFERSPMYHAQMLSGLLDVRDLTTGCHPELASLCERFVKPMAMLLNSIVHPDREIPLLNDSAFNESPPTPLLLERAGVEPSKEPNDGPAQVGDYWTYRQGQDYLLFDAGQVAPDHLPAHGHSDLLNIEMSYGGQRMITDSGVMNYADDPMREYCRSTAAHNVLQIDGEEQCDVYSKFRMGRRGQTSPLRSGEVKGFCWGAATHNAYRHLGRIEVGRLVACRANGPWIILDWATGHGRHTIDNRLHFHPEVELEQLDNHRVAVQLAGQTGQISALGRGSLSIDGSWYCPEFGRMIARPVLRWLAEVELPLLTGWCWQPAGFEGEARLDLSDRNRPAVVWIDDTVEVRLEPLELLKS